MVTSSQISKGRQRHNRCRPFYQARYNLFVFRMISAPTLRVGYVATENRLRSRNECGTGFLRITLRTPSVSAGCSNYCSALAAAPAERAALLEREDFG
jgi:hypothetical protein